MPKISVIIPTYNGSGCVEECLNSVVAQEGAGDAFDLEIIAVDDHSTDGTTDLMKKFPGIRILRTKRHSGGPNAGKNIGLLAATGDYVTFIDQDDGWSAAKIKRQLEMVPHAPIVFCDFQIVDKPTGKTDVYSDMSNRVICSESNALFLRVLKWKHGIKNPQPLMSSLLIHKSLIHIRFEEHFGFCDFDYGLRLFENRRTAHIRFPLVTRYVHGQNLSLDPDYRRTVYHYNAMILDAYEDRYPKEARIALANLNGTYARYFYKMGQMKKARKYLMRSAKNWKTAGYWMTSFLGSRYVRNRYRIFGT